MLSGPATKQSAEAEENGARVQLQRRLNSARRVCRTRGRVTGSRAVKIRTVKRRLRRRVEAAHGLQGEPEEEEEEPGSDPILSDKRTLAAGNVPGSRFVLH